MADSKELEHHRGMEQLLTLFILNTLESQGLRSKMPFMMQMASMLVKSILEIMVMVMCLGMDMWLQLQVIYQVHICHKII